MSTENMLGATGSNIAGQMIGTQRDNWKHRATGMRCDSCIWFVPKVRDVPEPKGEADSPDLDRNRELGRCRRHAPTMNGFPAVFEDDWCGDHKLDENKR